MEDARLGGQQLDDSIIVGRKISYVAVPATVGLLCYAGWNHHYFWAILGAGLLVCVASLVVGGLIGFLFGIPKTGEVPKQTAEAAGDTKPVAAPMMGGLRRNTNIEEISDWLTKIIVGLGIFELKSAPHLIRKVADFLAPAFGGNAGSGAIAVILATAFAATGFLLGYLLTVLFITQAIVRVEKPSTLAEKNLAQDAKAAKLVADVVAGDVSSHGIPDNVKGQVQSLAQRYERERASRPPGNERTAVMENITSELRRLALVAYPMIDDLTASSSPGDRLAAIAFLQIKPDAKWVDWLADCIAKETPFVRFQAALALRNAARALPEGDRTAVRAAIAKAKKILEDLKATDTNEYRKLREADEEST
jgi:hypothetical protein